MTTHISYETSKRLKEFLGGTAPEPMGNMGYGTDSELYSIPCGKKWDKPAYQLHDLLSRPFCRCFGRAIAKCTNSDGRALQIHLARLYFDGGLPTVEKALLEMMEEGK